MNTLSAYGLKRSYLDLIDEAVIFVDEFGKITFQNSASQRHFGDVFGRIYETLFGSDDICVDDNGGIWSVLSHHDNNEQGEVKILKKAKKVYLDPTVTEVRINTIPSYSEAIPRKGSSQFSSRNYSQDGENYRSTVFEKSFEEQTSGIAIFSFDRTCETIVPVLKNLAFETDRLARLPVLEGIPLGRPISKADHLFLWALRRVAKTGREEIISLSEGEYFEEVLIRLLSDRQLVSFHREKTTEARAIAELHTVKCILDSSSEATLSTDEQGRIILISKSAEKLFGIRREQLLGEEVFRFIRDSGDQIREIPFLKSSIGEKRLLCIHKEDGSTLQVSALVRTIRDSHEGADIALVIYSFADHEDQNLIPESAERTIKSLIETLSTVVEVRDPYTAGHQRRVSKLATAIAIEMGLSPDRLDSVREGALLHDIGKISVPTEILSKPGRLTENEWSLIQNHSEAGFRMLERIELPWPISCIVRQHHERLDGSGYPQGLKGREIPFETRIVSVADVFEAIVSHRPYRPAHERLAAITELTQGAGRIYDADVVDCCLSLVNKGFSLD